jgi:ribonuclease HI
MNNFCLQSKKNRSLAQEKWQPPQGDTLKINTDGSFFALNHSDGWGYVIRKAMGEVIMSAAGSVEHATNALETEAVAFLNALKAAGDLGADEVEVESDALCLVQALNGNGYDRASNGVLFKEIKGQGFLFLCPQVLSCTQFSPAP